MKKLINAIVVLIMGFFMLSAPALISATPTYAAEGGEPCSCDGGVTGTMTKGAILSYCECGHGESIKAVLQLVINILSIGVGIFGVIGITVVGIQYLTAGGSEEQTRKAKRRLFEIIIGLVVYAVAYGLLRWLLPGWSS